MKEEVLKVVEQLKNGKTILYPTDTIWGIGCDATNEKAIERIFEIKKRDKSKSLIVLVDSDRMLDNYLKEIPEMAWDIIDFVTKPTTIIYDSPRNFPSNLLAQDGSLAIRMVKEGFCHNLIKAFGKPIVSTSANISGEPSATTIEKVNEEIKRNVDFIVNLSQFNTLDNQPSSILKLSNNGEIKIIRK